MGNLAEGPGNTFLVLGLTWVYPDPGDAKVSLRTRVYPRPEEPGHNYNGFREIGERIDMKGPQTAPDTSFKMSPCSGQVGYSSGFSR